MSATTWLAGICGFLALMLVLVYYILLSRLTKKKAKGRKKRQQDLAQQEDPFEPAARRHSVRTPEPGERGQMTQMTKEEMAAHLGRGPETIEKEQALKRDALHVFRRLQHCAPEERSVLYAEAVKVFDSLESRGFSGMGSLTSAKIVFCNAVMECDGLEALRIAQDQKDPHATDLIERVIPVIFST